MVFEYYSLKKGIHKYVSAKVVKSNIYLSDSWLDFSPTQERTAFDIKIQKSEEYEDEDTLFNIEYYRAEEEMMYERQVETLSTAFSLTGGLMGLLASLVNFLIGWL